MTEQIKTRHKKPQRTVKQHDVDNLGIALSHLVGANVVKKDEFDKVNKERQALLLKVKNIDDLKIQLIGTECKLQSFTQYHKKWKPTTRNLEKKLSKLKKEKLYLDFQDYPIDISSNLKEAYNCYISGLSMSCYIMVLRTIEITIALIYKQHNAVELKTNGQPKFISASVKLNWVINNGMIGGADITVARAFIEARNESVHQLFIPTDIQLIAAFETVIILIGKLKAEIS